MTLVGRKGWDSSGPESLAHGLVPFGNRIPAAMLTVFDPCRPADRECHSRGCGRPENSLQVFGVGKLRKIRHLLDDADFHQQVGGFLGEGGMLSAEERLVGVLVLPAKVPGRVAEL